MRKASMAGASGSEKQAEGGRIRVGFLLTPVEFGGAERVCQILLENVNREEFELLPILLVRPWEGENFFARKLKARGLTPFEVPVALTETGDYLRVARAFLRVWRFLGGKRVDVLHTHGYFADIIGITAARLRRVPVVSTSHGYISSSWNIRLYNALDRRVLRLASRVLAVSEGLKNELIACGVRSGRIQVIANAVEADPVSEQERHAARRGRDIDTDILVVGYVGRLSTEKGLNFLLQACADVAKTGVALKVLVVGDGPDRGMLEALSSRLGIGDRVLFAGFQEDVRPWLSCFDVFVLPSLTEGTPMALLEAMSGGIPSIASAVGGVPAVISDRETGWLTPPGDAGEIGRAILELSGNPQMRARIARAGTRAVQKKFGIAEWIGRIQDVYRESTRAGSAP